MAESSQKTILITGASSGIGKAAAIAMAKLDFNVIILCIDQESGEKARRQIIRSSGNENIELEICDLSSIQAVKTWCKAWLAKNKPLHVLFNNAGVAIGKRTESVDGLEMMFATNYLGPFILTNLLLERLIENAPSRIVNNTSEGYKFLKELDFDNLQATKDFSIYRTYIRSKLAIIYFTQSLAKRLDNTQVTVNCFHPGSIRTRLGANGGFLFRVYRFFLMLFFISPKRGAKTGVYLSTSNEVNQISGKYFYRCKPKPLKEFAQDEEAAEKLWAISKELSFNDDIK